MHTSKNCVKTRKGVALGIRRLQPSLWQNMKPLFLYDFISKQFSEYAYISTAVVSTTCKYCTSCSARLCHEKRAGFTLCEN